MISNLYNLNYNQIEIYAIEHIAGYSPVWFPSFETPLWGLSHRGRGSVGKPPLVPLGHGVSSLCKFEKSFSIKAMGIYKWQQNSNSIVVDKY